MCVEERGECDERCVCVEEREGECDEDVCACRKEKGGM